MDRGAWWATVHGVTEKSDTTERLTHILIWKRKKVSQFAQLISIIDLNPYHLSLVYCLVELL